MPNEPTCGVVLIHGGLHAGWCWTELARSLSVPWVAVNLPGREGDPARTDAISAQDWAREAATQATALGTDQVVLVGHSLGGLTTLTAARLIPDLVAHLVFASALVPAEGQSIASMLAGENPIDVLFDASGMFPVPPPEVTRNLLSSDMGDDDAAALHARLNPEPRAPILEPFSWSGVPDVPRTYIRFLADHAVPWEMQEIMIGNLGESDQVVIDAGHNGIMTQAASVAAVVDDIARRSVTAAP